MAVFFCIRPQNRITYLPWFQRTNFLKTIRRITVSHLKTITYDTTSHLDSTVRTAIIREIWQTLATMEDMVKIARYDKQDKCELCEQREVRLIQGSRSSFCRDGVLVNHSRPGGSRTELGPTIG